MQNLRARNRRQVLHNFLASFLHFFKRVKNEICSDGDREFIFRYVFLGQIWGNLISFLVLRPTSKPTEDATVQSSDLAQKITQENITNSTIKNYQCGAKFFEKDFHMTTNEPVPMKLVSIDLNILPRFI